MSATNATNTGTCTWCATRDPKYVKPFVEEMKQAKKPRAEWMIHPVGGGSLLHADAVLARTLYTYAAWRDTEAQGLLDK